MNDELNIKDSLKATVTGSNASGIYFILENGVTAFAFFGRLLSGTQVTCSIKRMATESRTTLVSIDGVLYGDE